MQVGVVMLALLSPSRFTPFLRANQSDFRCLKGHGEAQSLVSTTSSHRYYRLTFEHVYLHHAGLPFYTCQ